jgi:hypothetical protein
MRIRLAAVMTAAVLLLPAAAAEARPSPAQPEKKCPSAMTFILDHCD